MCQFSWFKTVVELPHKSPKAQVYRGENIARRPTILKGASVRLGQVASFPAAVKRAPVVRLKKCDPVGENGKRIQNNRAGSSSLRRGGGGTRRRSSNQRRVMRWSSLNCLSFASPPPSSP